MSLFVKQVNWIENTIGKLFFSMDKNEIQMTIDNGMAKDNYQILFKGIWTGVLISLIVHQLINH